MRILQLTPRLPFPPVDGGRVVMLQTAHALHREGAFVQVLSLNPRKQHGDVHAASRALAPIPLEAIDIDTSRMAHAVIHGRRTGTPPLVARFHSPAFDERLRAILRGGRFDVVQIESPFLLPYLQTIRSESDALVVLRSLNVEFRIWESLASIEPRFLRWLALRTVARSLRAYETSHLNTCDAIVTITANDLRDFRSHGSRVPMIVVPAGVEVPALSDLGVDDGAVYFLGSLDYRPNQEAASWIAKELQPLLRSRGIAASLHVAGSRPPAWLRKELDASGVQLHADVPDASAFARTMSIMIVPLFSGGGMRLKILEAMALARPVISTRAGAAGVDAADGREIVLAENADAFADAIERLLRDVSRARAVAAAGHALVARQYDVATTGQKFIAFYEQLIRGRLQTSGHSA